MTGSYYRVEPLCPCLRGAAGSCSTRPRTPPSASPPTWTTPGGSRWWGRRSISSSPRDPRPQPSARSPPSPAATASRPRGARGPRSRARCRWARPSPPTSRTSPPISTASRPTRSGHRRAYCFEGWALLPRRLRGQHDGHADGAVSPPRRALHPIVRQGEGQRRHPAPELVRRGPRQRLRGQDARAGEPYVLVPAVYLYRFLGGARLHPNPATLAFWSGPGGPDAGHGRGRVHGRLQPEQVLSDIATFAEREARA